MNKKFLKAFVLEVVKVWVLVVALLCIGVGLANIWFPKEPMHGFRVLPL